MKSTSPNTAIRSGKPVLLVHGGPGAGSNPTMPRFHDPPLPHRPLRPARLAANRRRTPRLEENTTWDLVADMERIREHLGIERWQLFGGSWGSCLALAYGETHPRAGQRAGAPRHLHAAPQGAPLVLPGGRLATILPDAFGSVRRADPGAERGDLIAAYHRRLTGPDRGDARSPRRAPGACGRARRSRSSPIRRGLPPSASRTMRIAFARIECHYFQNGGFFETDDQLIARAGILREIPGVIVHGRYDLCTPAVIAWDLHRAWPEAELRIVPDSGHAMTEPGIIHELIAASEKFKARRD